MTLWRQLRTGVRRLLRWQRTDAEIEKELEHYVEELTAEYLSRGRSPAEARRAALLDVGSMTAAQEQVRDYGWENGVERVITDVRHGVRRLRLAPGFTVMAGLTLSLGIGATTTIFSAVNGILFRPLPYPEGDRIVMLWDVGSDGSRQEVTFGTYREITARSRGMEALAVMRPWQATLLDGSEPERLAGQRVSSDYFRVLGVMPALGRVFDGADDRTGGANVAILSHALWQRRFAGDPALIGMQITLDEMPYRVIGVMPEGFENVASPAAELWTLLQYDMTQGRAWGHHLRMIGRLRRGTDEAVAQSELHGIAATPVADFARPAWASLARGLEVTSLQKDVTRAVRPALLAILSAVLLVLVIAVVNVAHLMLARGVQRRSEFALRAALGAGRTRLIRQVIVESLMLAAVGGSGGIAVALLGVRALAWLAPPGLPRAGSVAVDGAVFAFALVITTLVGVAAGVIPAMQAAASDPKDRLEQGSRRAAGTRGRIRSALVVTEVLLAVVLLTSTALLLRSIERLFAVDPGFDADRVLTLQVQTGGSRFGSDSVTRAFFGSALDAVRRVPGVRTAALTSQLPMSGDQDLYGVHLDPPRSSDPGEIRGTYRYAVSPGYFEALGIGVRRGRTLRETDAVNAPRVAFVSESLARRRFAGNDPVGQRIRVGAEDGPPFTVVGVVADVKQLSLASTDAEAVYVPMAQWHFADPSMSLVVRASADPAGLATAVRQAIWSVDRDQAIVRVAALSDLLAASAAERRFALVLFQVFAFSALLLAAAGIYGVIAGGVAERTREIGVRSALGASRRDLVVMVVREGLSLTGIGVVLGLAAALITTRALAVWLFGVSPLDPVAHLSVVVLLAVTALAASALPAWRAARVDAARTLQAE